MIDKGSGIKGNASGKRVTALHKSSDIRELARELLAYLKDQNQGKCLPSRLSRVRVPSPAPPTQLRIVHKSSQKTCLKR